jgi:hypothetical protein
MTETNTDGSVDSPLSLDSTRQGGKPAVHPTEPRMAFCPACFVEVTNEQAGQQINAARVLAEFAKTAPGRLPQRVQDAIAVVTARPPCPVCGDADCECSQDVVREMMEGKND